MKKGQEFKVQVHHKDGIGRERWDKVIDTFRNEILQTPEQLITLCKMCHNDEEKRIKKEAAGID